MFAMHEAVVEVHHEATRMMGHEAVRALAHEAHLDYVDEERVLEFAILDGVSRDRRQRRGMKRR